MDVGAADMLMGMVGLVIPPMDILENLTGSSIEKRKYQLSFSSDEYITVESQGPVVSKWVKRNGDGELLFSWEGKEYYNKRGLHLPKIIKMSQNYPKQGMTLFYNSAKTNRKLPDNWCEMNIPEGVQTIEL